MLLSAGLDLTPSLLVSGVLQGLGYGVLAVGLVLLYRSSGVVNVAYGATGGLAAAVLVKLVEDQHMPYLLALAVALAVGAAAGAILELVLVRRLARAPRVTLLVGTIGAFEVLVYLSAAVGLSSRSSLFPTPLHRIVTAGSVVLTGKDLLTLAVVPALVLAVTLFLARTPTGLAIRAAADNADAAELAGIATRRMSTTIWALAGALATVAAALVDAEINLIPQRDPVSVGPAVLLSALAAALAGRLRSLPWALAGGVGVGVLRVVAQAAFPGTPGVADLATFLVVLAAVLTVPRERSRHDDTSLGLFTVGLAAGAHARQTAVGWAVLALGGALLPLVVTNAGSLFLADRTLLFAILGLSVLVLTGWAGQVSLGQVALAGVGGSVTAVLHARGVPFGAAVAEGVVAGVLVALVIGVPALRVRGLFLAITTLAFAVAAQQWLFALPVFGGHGTSVPVARPAGLSGDRAYYWLCEAALAGCVVLVVRLRASGVGRALIAVRANEDRAAASTLSPVVAKLTAFAVSGALAALAGGLLVGANGSSGPGDYGVYDSLTAVALVVVGGLAGPSGAVLGAALVLGLPAVFGASPIVQVLTSGIGVLIVLLFLPGGLMQLVALARRGWPQAAPGPARTPPAAAPVPPAPRPASATPVAPHPPGPPAAVLCARQVVVSFGGTRALDGVDLAVRPGEVLGLIGSNGAGKSTLLDVLSGFTRVTGGRVDIGDRDVTSLAPHLRARLGLGRMFQDARLFDDLSVRETVAVALEAHQRSELVPTLLGLPPARRWERRIRAEAAEHVGLLGLGPYADTPIAALSTGTRRIVELACLLAQDARLLLLDEPTAGLAQREAEAFGPLLADLRRQLQATMIIVEHDLPLVLGLSDRVQCLSAGRTIAEGPPTQVRSDPAVIAAYLGTDERAIARSGALGVLRPAPLAGAPTPPDAG
ncbi:MAG TPA: ATP-binding cassette domain-containing protein [Mycobacteriales bacterium]|nr:ATP-binding cassette domain-containing protein [Mycobacteriales bacterium]